MRKTEIGSAILLFMAACIWGVAFVAQSVGMEYVGPFTFNASRFLLGGLVLTPFALLRESNYRKQQKDSLDSSVKKRKHLFHTFFGGLCCGIAIFVASTFQQLGMQYTSVGKAGFITALYIVIVPIMGLFLHKKVSYMLWIGIILAAIGSYMLCITESFHMNQGDLLVFACAVCFSFHILIIDYFAPKADGVALSCIQFWFSGIVSLLVALLTEKPQFGNVMEAAVPIMYAGIMSCGVAYTLQILGQKGMKPAVASLILSMESVISVLAGWMILQEVMTRRQLVGCVLMFVAVILAQIPVKTK